MSGSDYHLLDNVSRFYGEVLGVNRVTLSIPPGITSLVGPNGSGKTTLMNLMTGLVRPTYGQIRVLGIAPSEPQKLFRLVGYSTQFDSFPRGPDRISIHPILPAVFRIFGGCEPGTGGEGHRPRSASRRLPTGRLQATAKA